VIEATDLMLATARKRPFSDVEWLFQLKLLCAPFWVLRFMDRLVAGRCVSRCV
jgi:hypothetical protein